MKRELLKKIGIVIIGIVLLTFVIILLVESSNNTISAYAVL